jgi:hypothetical protein
VWLPEQTAALASLATPDAQRLAPLPETGAEPTTSAAVLDALRDLAAHEPLVGNPVDPDTVCADVFALPLPLLLPLGREARAAVGPFGAALTSWIAAAPPRYRPAEAAFWSEPPVPLDPLAHAATSSLVPTDLATIAAGVTLAWAAGRRGGDATLERLSGCVALSWPRAVGEVPRGARVSVAFASAAADAVGWLKDLALAPLARALAGTIVPVPGRGPRTAPDDVALAVTLAIESGGRWNTAGTALAAPARLLTPDPCAPCLFAAALDDDRALVTRQDLGGSYLVDGTGGVTAAPGWPVPILAESPWAEPGLTFAWSTRPGRLLVRDASGAVRHDVPLPFTPTSAVPDGGAIRFTALDGLWRWTPRSGLERLVETPPLVFAAARNGAFDLALLPAPVDRPQRRRTTRVLAWSADGLREHDAPALGPCWSRTTQNGWTAEALPDANLVAVSDARGAAGWVIADYPRTVAWAGASLIVVTTGGAVLFVPDVRQRLG